MHNQIGQKQIVTFQKTHGRYVKGDVAGFDAATIAKWPQGVCVPYDPAAIAQVNEAETSQLTARAADLEARMADLAARERALLLREAALSGVSATAAPSAVEDEAASDDETAEQVDAKAAASKPAGAPPKQGAKA